MAVVTALFFAVTIPLDLQSNGVMDPLRNHLLFVVTSYYFVTFRISVTNNCNGNIAIKMGNRL